MDIQVCTLNWNIGDTVGNYGWQTGCKLTRPQQRINMDP